MKTFSTEKHNIPEGATHYIEESRIMTFGWAKGLGTDCFSVYPVESGEGRWIGTSEPIHAGVLKPIPQTKEVEWVNGDTVEYHNKHEGEGGILTFVGIHPTHKDHAVLYGKHLNGGYMSAPLSMISKPETEVERVEREREDAINEMSLIVESGNGFAGNAYKKYCASLYDAGYRKES